MGRRATLEMVLDCGDREPKAAKNRMHVDIVTEDIEVEVARLEALGARRLHDGMPEFRADTLGNDGRSREQRVLCIQRRRMVSDVRRVAR